MANISWIDLGKECDYQAVLDQQREILQQKIIDKTFADTVFVLEHSPVYTYGTGSLKQSPLGSPAQSVPWHEVSRGGEATFHGPGQIIIYPIVDLTRCGFDLKGYLRILESTIIKMLSYFGISAYAREGLTGVWINMQNDEPRKIASLGIGVKKWISYHGIALNISTDLKYFQAISPCGLGGGIMTNLLHVCEFLNIPLPSEEELKEKIRFFLEANISPVIGRKPYWIRNIAPGHGNYTATHRTITSNKLVTVCEEARCPNRGECWAHRTATFMIMGEVCTRACGFCAVQHAKKGGLLPLDPKEPLSVAEAVQQLQLKHVVITSVDRDDLADMGAGHFATTAKAIKKINPHCTVEVLIPDFRGDNKLLQILLADNCIDILGHNVETVPSLHKKVRPGSKMTRSLFVLQAAKEIAPNILTKSSIMVGLGETREEVMVTLKLLREIACDFVTVGQYLQPTSGQLPVEKYYLLEEFAWFKDRAYELGFKHVESGPLVRSSYHAAEAMAKGRNN
ncbi:MAG: lipoyl synthase [Deltaproteobacteria bacterium]|nr:lipoyl synthase [Deltaproteobacteria bacterium]